MFSHRYRYFFILALALFTFINTIICEVYFYFRINIDWYWALIVITAITLFIWESNRILEPYFKKGLAKAPHQLRFHFLYFLTGMLLAGAFTLLIVPGIGMLLLYKPWTEIEEPLKLNMIYAGLCNLLFHLLHAIFYYFSAYLNKRMEAEELRRISTQSQLQLIKSQINPHFLFNSLNVLSGLVLNNNKEANTFIEAFSKVYRYILNNQEKEIVTLQSEIDFVKPYIFLLEKRFNEGLKIDIDIPDKYNNWFIIPVALQMLIENAIKHNVVSRSKPLHILLKANGDESLLVRNNKQPKLTPEISSGIGLKNIQQRYELVSGQSVKVVEANDYFEVILPLLKINE